MCEQFIKIKQLGFPGKPKNGYSGWSEQARTARGKIAAELEAWLVKLLGDEVICESKILVQFLTESDGELRSIEDFDVRRRTRSELIGGKLMSAMKAAGGVVKTVAKTAGKLAINVPGRMLNFVDTLSDPADTSSPRTPQPRSTHSNDPNISEISPTDLEIILECLFTTLEETFNLSQPHEWIRQKSLHLVKKLLRRTYSATLTTTLQSTLQHCKTAETSSNILQHLLKNLWPQDQFFQNNPPPPRTDQQQLDTKLEAKQLFVGGKLLGIEALVHIVGGYNCVNGLTRVFNMGQDRRLNRVVVCMLVDGCVRTLFDSS